MELRGRLAAALLGPRVLRPTGGRDEAAIRAYIRRIVTLIFGAAASLALAAGSIDSRTGSIVSTLSPEARLGRQIFFDPSLSASGQLSCASCHSPAYAYTSPAGGAAPTGGPHLDRQGLRTVPSLRYLDHTPRFTRHYYLTRGADLEDLGPAGGFMLDGRAGSLHEQALLPWMDSAEMGNPSVEALSRRLQRSAYASEFRDTFGSTIFAHPADAVASAGWALERFQLEDPSFHPYSSRYDRFLTGQLQLSAQELRGLRVFSDPLKGNCADCHPNTPGPGGRPPDFTDYGYRALGVPRNADLSANADPNFYDLGLCGPRRTDLQAQTRYCGYFKTPTLRNVARRERFFHNGRFRTLEQVLRFYAERDTTPQKWYPRVDGRVHKFDDLPTRYRDRVDISDPPFDQRRNDGPAFTQQDTVDLIAFLKALNDAD